MVGAKRFGPGFEIPGLGVVVALFAGDGWIGALFAGQLAQFAVVSVKPLIAAFVGDGGGSGGVVVNDAAGVSGNGGLTIGVGKPFGIDGTLDAAIRIVVVTGGVAAGIGRSLEPAAHVIGVIPGTAHGAGISVGQRLQHLGQLRSGIVAEDKQVFLTVGVAYGNAGRDNPCQTPLVIDRGIFECGSSASGVGYGGEFAGRTVIDKGLRIVERIDDGCELAVTVELKAGAVTHGDEVVPGDGFLRKDRGVSGLGQIAAINVLVIIGAGIAVTKDEDIAVDGWCKDKIGRVGPAWAEQAAVAAEAFIK